MKLRLELFGIAVVFTAAVACSSSSSPPAATDAGDNDAGGSTDTGAVGEPNDGAVATATTITCGGAMWQRAVGCHVSSLALLPAGQRVRRFVRSGAGRDIRRRSHLHRCFSGNA